MFCRCFLMATLVAVCWDRPAAAVSKTEPTGSTRFSPSGCHPEPDSSFVLVTFDKTYMGNYRPGEPYDYVTIAADGQGETFAESGISITLFLRTSDGRNCVGIPAQEIQLYSPDLCICPGGSIADRPTDLNGMTSFSGTIAGGGCTEMLSIYFNGVRIGTTGVKINSTDTGLASPCATDAGDFSALAARLGRPEQWSICFDYNESGPPTIDAGDLSYFAAVLGAGCR